MKDKIKDELLKEFIETLRPALQKMVEEIIEERLRLDPHALGGTAETDRRSFLDRSIKK